MGDERECGTYLAAFQELDIITPYLPAVFVLPDVVQCKLV
jgi:hypothetical protein